MTGATGSSAVPGIEGKGATTSAAFISIAGLTGGLARAVDDSSKDADIGGEVKGCASDDAVLARSISAARTTSHNSGSYLSIGQLICDQTRHLRLD